MNAVMVTRIERSEGIQERVENSDLEKVRKYPEYKYIISQWS